MRWAVTRGMSGGNAVETSPLDALASWCGLKMKWFAKGLRPMASPSTSGAGERRTAIRRTTLPLPRACPPGKQFKGNLIVGRSTFPVEKKEGFGPFNC